MATIDEAKARAANNERLRTMEAMERIVLTMGNRTHYAAWLDIFPAGITLDAGGGVNRDDMAALAADESAFDAAVKAWAALLLPVLTALA